MAISTLTFSDRLSFGWTASNNLTGSDYQPVTNATSISKSLTMGNSVSNATSLGGDELYSAITSIAASGNASIDLTSITDILQTTGVSLARVKAIVIRLLDATDDSVVVTGTPATSITIDGTVTNGLSAQSHSGWFDNTASNFALTPGDFMAWGTKKSTGVVVDSTHKVIKFVNNDSSNTAKVQLTVFGGST